MPPADIGSFALLASIWPWLSLGTGDEDSFVGNLGSAMRRAARISRERNFAGVSMQKVLASIAVGVMSVQEPARSSQQSCGILLAISFWKFNLPWIVS